MEQNKQLLKANKETSMSKLTEERISVVADDIKGRELFTKKIELAKKTLSNLKSLPI